MAAVTGTKRLLVVAKYELGKCMHNYHSGCRGLCEIQIKFCTSPPVARDHTGLVPLVTQVMQFTRKMFSFKQCLNWHLSTLVN